MAAGLLPFPPAARGEVRFELTGDMRGSVRALEIVVRLRNTGNTPAAHVKLNGELAENRAESETANVGPSETVAFSLRYPPDLPRPGIYVATLLIDYQDGAHGPNGPRLSQRGFLKLAISGNPPPAVELSVPAARVDASGAVSVELESADGAAHRTEVRVFTPRGLNADVPEILDVPPSGRVSARVRILRAGAGYRTRHGILAVARKLDGPLERASVVTGVVEVGPDPALLPRVRRPLVALGVALLLLAFGLELRMRWPRRTA